MAFHEGRAIECCPRETQAEERQRIFQEIGHRHPIIRVIRPSIGRRTPRRAGSYTRRASALKRDRSDVDEEEELWTIRKKPRLSLPTYQSAFVTADFIQAAGILTYDASNSFILTKTQVEAQPSPPLDTTSFQITEHEVESYYRAGEARVEEPESVRDRSRDCTPTDDAECDCGDR